MKRFGFIARATMLAVAASFLAAQALRAEEPAKKEEPKKPVQVKPYRPPVPAQLVPPGQPAQVKPGEKPATPISPGRAPNVVKSASDIPEPTVQLKEGEVPGVKFDTPTYDFGRVRSGQEVTHDFWFSNTGTGPLELLKVRPACGCTTAGQHDKIVQPGESGKIPIKLNTGNTSGPIHKTITVNTNCTGEGQVVTLHIQGEVWHPIQTTPSGASFGRLTAEAAADAPQERKLTIVNNTEEKVEIKDVVVTNPSFKATVAALEEGKRWELTATVVPPLGTGPVTGTIELTTTLKDMPKVQIPVNAYVTADVDVTPNQLTLPANRNGNIQRQFFVRNNTVNPVALSDVAASSDKLKVNLIETQPVGKAYRLTVDIPQDYVVAASGDKITVKTDNPRVPMLEIPITQAPSPGEINRQFGVAPGQATPAGMTPVGAAGGTPAAQPASPTPADAKK